MGIGDDEIAAERRRNAEAIERAEHMERHIAERSAYLSQRMRRIHWDLQRLARRGIAGFLVAALIAVMAQVVPAQAAFAPATTGSCTIAQPTAGHTTWGTTDSFVKATPSLDTATTESLVCRQFQTVRLYYNLGQNVINTRSKALISSGHTLMASIDPTSGSTRVPYSTIANTTTWDSYFTAQFKAIEASAPHTYFIFGHEADSLNDCGSLSISACGADFVAAWLKLRALAQQAGATALTWVWTMEAWGFNPHSNRSGLPRATYFFPGAANIDLIGEDGYNFSGCLNGSFDASKWKSFDSFGSYVNTWATANAPSVPIAAVEWGSVENPSNATAKAGWINDTSALMQTPAYSHWVLMSSWNSIDTLGSHNCDLRIDTSSSALAAYKNMGLLAYFDG